MKTNIAQAIDRIKDVLKAFRQNNLQEDYLELLDELSDAAIDWYNEAYEELEHE
jgi:hypothetical protein